MTTAGQQDSTVDLTNCDREPIHLLGRIQSFGILLAFSPDWVVVEASENAGALFGLPLAELLGAKAEALFPAPVLKRIQSRLPAAETGGTTERLFDQPTFDDERRLDMAVHISGDRIVLEAELTEATDSMDIIGLVRTLNAQLRTIVEDDGFFELVAQQVRSIVGFDRVMIYRFRDDGAGEVIAEARTPEAESYRGLRYPASDIPSQARALYCKNIFRIIANVDDPGVPIIGDSADETAPLDLSRSTLRSVSPIHIQYLKNMGVGASLSISILVDGALWGLIACHHLTPRLLSFERRITAELYGEFLALELSNRQRAAASEIYAVEREIHDKILLDVGSDGSLVDGLSQMLPRLGSLIQSDGVGLWCDGRYVCHGQGPRDSEIAPLLALFNATVGHQPYATDHLAREHPDAAHYLDRAAGILVIPISRKTRDYLMFFRRELTQTVDWAGNPQKPVTQDDQNGAIQPRRSFALWREEVRGRSAPWTARDLKSAESLRVILLEVILRSVDHTVALQKRARESQDLLVSELNHRVRNILTLISGVVRHTAGTVESIEEFVDVIGGRIQALARAHDQLTRSDWTDAPLRTLLFNEVDAYGLRSHDRVKLEGPEVHLAPAAYTCVALVMHEMVTNSAKYGALSDRRGTLNVVWVINADGSLAIDWEERDGPPVAEPSRRGFGSSIIERAIPYELNGTAAIEYATPGVRASFAVPAKYVLVDGEGASLIGPPDDEENTTMMAPDLILENKIAFLLEDNVIIALDAEGLLLEIGFAEVLVANSLRAANAIIDGKQIDFALLDINLGDDNSVSVAEKLAARGVPIMFASGYTDNDDLPDHLRHIPVITKPYSKERISESLGLLQVSRD